MLENPRTGNLEKKSSSLLILGKIYEYHEILQNIVKEKSLNFVFLWIRLLFDNWHEIKKEIVKELLNFINVCVIFDNDYWTCLS